MRMKKSSLVNPFSCVLTSNTCFSFIKHPVNTSSEHKLLKLVNHNILGICIFPCTAAGNRVSVKGVESLGGDCRFIPAD